MDAKYRSIDWSYTKSDLFSSCPRAFYHRYVQSSSSDAPKSSEPQGSRYSENPGSIIGTAVHDSISEQIERWKLNRHTSVEDACQQAESIIQESIENFDTTDQQADLERSMAGIARKHLRNFFQNMWPQFSSHQYIVHEESISFSVAGHTVWVRPDLCTRDSDGRFIITDWKTSDPELIKDPSEQLLVYAMWANREFEPDLDRILLQYAYTNTGEFQRSLPNQTDIEKIEDQIISDCTEWNSSKTKSDFSAEPSQQKCSNCSYVPICPPGSDALRE